MTPLLLSLVLVAGCGPQGTGGSQGSAGQAAVATPAVTAGGATDPSATKPPPAPPASEVAGPTIGGAGSDGSDHSGSGMSAALEGVARKPLDHEEFEAIMKANKADMGALKAAIDGQDQATALAILDRLAANAEKAMASEPEKRKELKAAYIALFGSLKTASRGLRGVVKMGVWTAVQPGFNVIGQACASCHQQFRLSPEERAALEAGAGQD